MTALFLTAVTGLAQTPRATLTGTVFDPQDAAVPGAEIEATHVATGISHKATSSADGTYTVPNLPIGEYRVTVTAPGFKSFV
ncbi:MAG: carboxypeptidase regulatory-like domain-containing protein, partial [Moorella sp. (in: Bacteria)]|nr:carboxypeptidase regulatory-like domain-containing protein [Moorella sp. (in: firmicutes)]